MTTKKPKIEPVADNMGIITLRYGDNIIMPYDDAIKVMEHFKKAELFKDGYNEPSEIIPIDTKSLSMKIISQQEYLQIKMDQLLGLNKKGAEDD